MSTTINHGQIAKVEENGDINVFYPKTFSQDVYVDQNKKSLETFLGNTDISAIGDGTVSGAIFTVNSNLSLKQNTTDNSLSTAAKTIVGGINEINDNTVKWGRDTGKKVVIMDDAEGGNIRIYSPSGNHAEIDMAGDTAFRIYFGTPTQEVTGVVATNINTAVDLGAMNSTLATKANQSTVDTLSYYLRTFSAGGGPHGDSHRIYAKHNVKGDGRFYLQDEDAHSVRVNYADGSDSASVADTAYVLGRTAFAYALQQNGWLSLRTTSGVSSANLNNTAHQIIEASQFVVGSSKRIKENISAMTNEEAKKLLNINVIKFDYKKEFGDLKDQFGVIAEDVNDIIPSVVHIDANYDETKEVSLSDNNPPSVDYSKFVPFLIKMVQMQQKEINELKKKLGMIA